MPLISSESVGEACGVFGVRASNQPVSHLTYLGLFALQHRGQESAGIAVSDSYKIWVDKGMGLVSAVFDDNRLRALTGHLAIGHTRYSTTGTSTWGNSQPIYRSSGGAQFALAHNGNLVNTAELAAEVRPCVDACSDSDVVAELLARELPADGGSGCAGTLEEALVRVLPRLRGAFTFVAMDEEALIGVRDPNGFRPLFLGRLADGWVLASETPALDVVGASTVREVAPGEMVVVDAAGVRSRHPFAAEVIDPRLCVFEFVYFARPDGELLGRSVYRARQRMGEELAAQAPADVDLVIAVPESSIPGAQGYARGTGIPYGDGFIKNRYIGRTFISPNQELRRNAVRIKLNPIKEMVAGRRLVVVEDSIVRATTLRETVRMLRDVGAAEVHLRVLSPPYRWPCFFGMDTADRSQLIAAERGVPEIRDYLGAESLAYLSLEGLLRAVGTDGREDGFCAACLTGRYPVPVSSAS